MALFRCAPRRLRHRRSRRRRSDLLPNSRVLRRPWHAQCRDRRARRAARRASDEAAQESSCRNCRRRFAQRESGDPVPLGPQACVRGSSRVLQKRERVTLLLGAIADDFTGATDLANTLVRGGMRTIQTIGVPEPGAALDEADAIVVALKSRSIPADEAVRLSLEALDALQERGASKFIFKYCSTFDSTDHGNIGPVADALLDRLGSDVTIFCPAFPENGRRLFNGYLFVGDVLLSESGMEKHPITPMTDPNLVRVLGRQTKHKVGKVDLARVRRGEAAVRTAVMEARGAGVRHLVVDAVSDEDLHAIGLGTEELPLITGGSDCNRFADAVRAFGDARARTGSRCVAARRRAGRRTFRLLLARNAGAGGVHACAASDVLDRHVGSGSRRESGRECDELGERASKRSTDLDQRQCTARTRRGNAGPFRKRKCRRTNRARSWHDCARVARARR